MKILSIQPFLKGFPSISPVAGGKDKAALEICRALVLAGHQVDILPLPWGLEKRNNDILCNKMPVLLSPDGLQANVLPTLSFPSPKESSALLWKFLRAGRSWKETWASARDMIWRSFTDKRRSILNTLTQQSYDAILVNQTGSDLPKFAKEVGFKGKLILAHHSSGRSAFIPEYDHTVFVSETQRRYALELYPDIESSSSTIYYFGDSACFRETSFEPKNEITFIGILDTKRKGLDILLEAYRTTPELSRVTLNVIGDGPLRAEFESFAKQHNLPAHFHGKVSVEQNATCLSRSGAYVMPSRAEGLALTYIEALCMGVPIIGFPPNVDELATLLNRDVGYAFHADQETPAQLAANILSLTKQDSHITPTDRMNLSADARARFSLDAFHRNYVSTIEAVAQ